MTEKTITLGNQQYTIAALPLGKLKKVLPAVSSVAIAMSKAQAVGELEEDAFESIAVAIAVSIGKTVQEVEAMVIQPSQLIDAVLAISEVCGLVGKQGPQAGETVPGGGSATTQTPSTDSLPTS